MIDPRVVDGLRFQRRAVDHASLASPLYAALLDATLADLDASGPCASVLARVPPGLDPGPDAVALRFLGAVHRLVLSGQAPALARWYPSAGGAFDAATDGDAAGRDFVATVDAHAEALVAGLELGVQTNEVGRCATLAVGFTLALRTWGLPLRLLELGASAGLNLRWDRWRYEAGPTAWGREDAALRFEGNYREPWPDLAAPLGPGEAVAERRGCDRSPIDPTSEADRLLLRSFVWPDQRARFERLDAALVEAALVPAAVDAADAGAWVAERLAEPSDGTATVVFHSIVWQYLPAATREAVRAAVESAGAEASDEAPVGWLRMEPGDDPTQAAELRLRTWPAGDDRVVALSGYHGHPVWSP